MRKWDIYLFQIVSTSFAPEKKYSIGWILSFASGKPNYRVDVAYFSGSFGESAAENWNYAVRLGWKPLTELR